MEMVGCLGVFMKHKEDRKKVLVTGGAGFIGSHIVDVLIKEGYKARIFDNLEPQVHPQGKIPIYLNKKAEFVKGDVRKRKELERAIQGMDAIFHMASSVGIAQSQYQIKKYVDVNIGGTANLFDILSEGRHKIKKLIIFSSNTTYGEGMYKCPGCGLVKLPLREKTPPKHDWRMKCFSCKKFVEPVPTPEEVLQDCNSIYAITKKTQEEMTRNIGKTYNIPFVILRCFNVYGPRQSLSNPYTGVAAIFLSRLKNNKPPIIYEDGMQTRDFISVYDVVRASVFVLQDKRANNHTFNLGSGNPISIKKVAKTLAKLCHKKIKPIITGKFRKGDIRHCYADISRIEKILGFKPRISFEEGMKNLVEWSRKERGIDKFDEATLQLKKKGLI